MHVRGASESSTLSARELALAALALALFSLAVLWRPLAKLDTHTFGPFDVPTQLTSLTRLGGAPSNGNSLLYDPAAQMHVWARHGARELAAGRLPLWNPCNGCGAPLHANYQAAYLSPFTLPFYVLPFRIALIASAAAKLLALALATYAYLRTIELSRVAALAGAVIFATAGVQLLYLPYPHPGVLVLLPAGLFWSERVLRGVEAGAPLRLGSLAGLGLTFLGSALAGHPETLFFASAALALYVAVRGIGIARAAGDRRSLARALGSLALAGSLGLAAAAVQIVPFVEYLAHSSARHANRGAAEGLAHENWPLLAFPDLVGTPSPHTLVAPDLPYPNYEEFTSFYVGSLAMLLALSTLVAAWRNRSVRPLLVALAIGTVYAWDPFGATGWLGKETPLRLLPVHRSQPLWTLPIAVLAAFAIDRAWRARAPSWARVGAVAAAAGLGWLVFRWGAERYVEAVARELERDVEPLLTTAREHMWAMGSALAIGCAGLAGLWLVRSAVARAVAVALLLAAMLAQTGWLLADYTPTVEDRFVYPRTPAIEALQAAAGRERTLFLTPDTFAADANLDYDLRIETNYDALGVAAVDELAARMLGGGYDKRMTLRASKKALALFGLSYVAVNGDWVPIDTELGEPLRPRFDVAAELRTASGAAGDLKGLVELRAGRVVRTAITASRDGLDALTLHFADDPRTLARRVSVELTEVETGRRVARRELTIGELPATGLARRELVHEFARQPGSRGVEYALEVRSLDAEAAAWPRVLAFQGARNRDRNDDPEREIRLQFDLAYDRADFVRVGRVAELTLFRFGPSPGRAWIVERATAASSHEEALARIEASDFDPWREVVIEGLDRARDGGVGGTSSVEILEEHAGRLRLRASCDRPSFLVLAQSHFPGWRARVGGEVKPLVRANYAFSAVALPAGQAEVEIEYAPGSLRLGLAISLAALAAGVASLAWARVRRRARA